MAVCIIPFTPHPFLYALYPTKPAINNAIISNIIRNTLKRYDVDKLDDIDGFEFIENKRNPNYDPWNEPTDGKWHARTFRDYLNNMGVRFLYFKERDIKEHLNNFKRYKRRNVYFT